jgi:DNA-binding transcriptional LysR family regulator
MDRRLGVFLAVVEAGSLTAAARRLCVTQPALTKSLRSLEGELGALLFARKARGVSLTAAGAVLLARASSMRRTWQSAREELRAMSSADLDVFRIGAGPAYHPVIVPRLASRLLAEFPDTRIEMDTGVNDSEMPRLVAGEIDLMLGAFDGPIPEGLERRVLLDIETVIYARSSHPLTRLANVDVAALGDARWVVYKKDDMVHARINAWLAAAGCPSARIVVRVGALGSGFEIVGGSDFLMSAPRQVAGLAARYGLVALPCVDPIWRFRSGACLRSASLAYPIVRRSLEILGELCAVLPGTPHPVLA